MILVESFTSFQLGSGSWDDSNFCPPQLNVLTVRFLDNAARICARCSGICGKHCWCFLSPSPLHGNGECFLPLSLLIVDFVFPPAKTEHKSTKNTPAGSLRQGSFYLYATRINRKSRTGVKRWRVRGSRARIFSTRLRPVHRNRSLSHRSVVHCWEWSGIPAGWVSVVCS